MSLFHNIHLPYELHALEPVISENTLAFHYGKHLQAYVDNLNKLLPESGLQGLSLEEIVAKSSGALFNNAGQVLNHNLYFTQFAPAPHPGLDPGSPLGKQIVKQWGSVDSFKAEFESKGVSLFGSGWVWLQANSEGVLSIAQYTNADNPVAHGLKPILTFDVWEHAYYLDYQNKRAAYLQALWQLLNWEEISRRYSAEIM